MTPDVRIRLQDMLTFARSTLDMVDRLGEPAIRAEWGLQMGLIKAVEVIGEAAFQIPRDERPHLDGVPWGEIVGMRHHLVHGYSKLRLDAVFEVIRGDLPRMISALQEVLQETPE